MNLSRVVAAGVLWLMLAACKDTIVGFNRGLVIDQFSFEYLSARAKISYQDGKQNLSAIANIRIKKDSLIWVSVSKLGIEGARLKINRDSVWLINRLKRTYVAKSFTQLSKDFDFDLNYEMIESVVLGNLIYPYQKEKLNRQDNYIQYDRQSEGFLLNNFIGAQSKKLEKLTVEDASSNNTLSVHYGDFKEIDNEILPFTIAAMIRYARESKENIAIRIAISKAQISPEPLRFPFGKPAKYSGI